MTQTSKQPQPDNRRMIYNVPEGYDARLLAEKAMEAMRSDRIVLHVTSDDRRMSVLSQLIRFFEPDCDVLEFPAWDCLPYDRVSPSGDIVAKRVAVLSDLLSWQKDKRRRPRIVLTTVNAASQRLMPRSALSEARLHVQKGDRLDLEDLQSFLQKNGYTRIETVREPGEYAIRGGIIDIYPSGAENPVRFDLFGDEVDQIRSFDPLSQRSGDGINVFELKPGSEVFLQPEDISRFRKNYLELFGKPQDNDQLYEAVSDGRRYNGMEHWLPLFYSQTETLFDYAGDAIISEDYHANDAFTERLQQIEDFYQARKTVNKATAGRKNAHNKVLQSTSYNPVPVERLYLNAAGWEKATGGADIFCPFSAPGGENTLPKKGRDFGDVRALPDGDVFEALNDYMKGFEQPKIIVCYSEGSADRMEKLLETAAISDLKHLNSLKELKSLKGRIGLAIVGLERGFIADDMVIVTEQDILGDRMISKSAGKKKRADNFLREVSALNQNDLVVHVEHGIGKFLALETLQAAGTYHDCLKIEYAGGDKLYVPVENLDVLSRYGSNENALQLDKLGGAGWQARKAQIKKDLMEMADHLLSVAASRQLKPAPQIEIDSTLYNEFAARFPYQETDDQARAIQDTLKDLEADYPMDRLICGDVGFGKTEVALRAAYTAVMSGFQVAVIVPTTLLARQHTQNFEARFTGTGIRIGQLSRMVKSAEAKRVKEGLRDGSVNIVIGTHALLSKDVGFSKLALVVVDEEQKFGVKQKEKLKELQTNAHVLTLSATPIPRTLQMSLTGVKELSLITTPPVDRLAIRTFVMAFDPVIIREAIMREHYRGGQTFYVCPRIKDMDDLEEELRELVPEVKITTAHGQMSADDLDDRMTAFYEGQYDVLLATNIIESGLDIPSANTMIVHRSDLFGLAQLYQIRGRIGRSKVRAYAYLTYPPHLRLNDNAIKRLEVMETLDTLGSGFQLASHDLDIRGAGNLLGEQQSGHIKEVGVELYQQMLEEAVAAAKEGVSIGESVQERSWSPTINVGTSVLIPERYVPDLGVRMSLYRRLQDLETASHIDGFAAELIDRFGDLPGEVENLLDIVAIKQLCKKAGVQSVEAGPKGAVISFKDNTPPNVEGLMRWIQDKTGAIKIRPDQSIVAKRNWDKTEYRVSGVKSLMQELADLV